MLKKAAVVLSGSFARLALSAVGGLVIAQLIGPPTRGMLTIVMTAATLVSLLCGAGLQGSTTYMIGAGRWRASDAIIIAAGVSLLTVAVSIPGLGFMVQRLHLIGSLERIPAWIVGVGGGLLVLSALLGAALTGLQLYGRGATSAVAVPIANFVIFFALLFSGVSGARSALAGWAGGLAAGALVSGFFLVRAGKAPWRFPPEIRFALGYGARTLAGNLLNYANLRLDVLILARLAGLTATGEYSVAVAMSETLWAVPMAIGTVVFPEIASRGKECGGEWTAKVCRFTLLVTSVASVALALVGVVLFGFVMRHYTGALVPLLLLLPGTLGLTVARVLGNDLYGRSMPEWHMYAAAVSIVVTVVGDIITIPVLGAAGAAIVSSLAYGVYAAIILVGFTRSCRMPLKELVPSAGDMREVVRLAGSLLRRGRAVDA